MNPYKNRRFTFLKELLWHATDTVGDLEITLATEDGRYQMVVLNVLNYPAFHVKVLCLGTLVCILGEQRFFGRILSREEVDDGSEIVLVIHPVCVTYNR